jgi:hypothetical protein
LKREEKVKALLYPYVAAGELLEKSGNPNLVKLAVDSVAAARFLFAAH